MLPDRLRKQFAGKPVEDANQVLQAIYPLGEVKWNDVDSLAVFYTNQPVPLSSLYVDEDPLVIDMGMYVDENGLLQIYDRKMKL